MSQLEKLALSFREARTFRYRDFERMLLGIGFVRSKAGATGGSRRKFVHSSTMRMIWLDEPHDGEMRPAMVSRLRDQLEQLGLL
jgi:hypothetical protein